MARCWVPAGERVGAAGVPTCSPLGRALGREGWGCRRPDLPATCTFQAQLGEGWDGRRPDLPSAALPSCRREGWGERSFNLLADR